MKSSGVETDSFFKQAGLSDFSRQEESKAPRNEKKSKHSSKGSLTWAEFGKSKASVNDGMTSWAEMNQSVFVQNTNAGSLLDAIPTSPSKNSSKLEDIESPVLQREGYRIRPVLIDDGSESEEDDHKFAGKIRGYTKRIGS